MTVIDLKEKDVRDALVDEAQSGVGEGKQGINMAQIQKFAGEALKVAPGILAVLAKAGYVPSSVAEAAQLVAGVFLATRSS